MFIRINNAIYNSDNISEIVYERINEDISEINLYNSEGLLMKSYDMTADDAERAWESIRMLSDKVYEFKTLS